jgi:hypothetical protein
MCNQGAETYFSYFYVVEYSKTLLSATTTAHSHSYIIQIIFLYSLVIVKLLLLYVIGTNHTLDHYVYYFYIPLQLLNYYSCT